MKYFTWQRFLDLQDFDRADMDAADAEWEAAVEQYEAYLQTIRANLLESVRQLLDGFWYHDARVLSMGHRGDLFTMTLQLDAPPNELLTITYQLAGPPEMKKHAGAEESVAEAPLWQYEELEVIGTTGVPVFMHSILFDNGWELCLPFRAVELTTVGSLYPIPGSIGVPGTPAFASPVA